MKKIVLLRHGESIWNKENPFTRNLLMNMILIAKYH